MTQQLNYFYDHNTPLLKFSKFQKDDWLIDDAYKGTFICGGTGSGKSSGSGRSIAHAFLKAGFGGLVLCDKPNEANTWRRYCQETGRENSLIVMDGTAQKRFNFIDYELARVGGGNYKTPFALDAFMKIYEAMQVYDGNNGGGGNESFWKNSVRLILSHSIDAVYLAFGRLQFSALMEFVRTAPTAHEEAKDPSNKSFHMETLRLIKEYLAKKKQFGYPIEEEKALYDAVCGYLWGFYALDDKTRSNIQATLEAMVLDFTKGDLVKLFCTDTNIVPEMTHEGAVIILDFPTLEWQRGGVLAQHLFKFAWQRAASRRKVDTQTRPIFLWADEYQKFISEYDDDFQSTARGFRVCTVYLTQSIPALRKAVKSAIPKDAVDSLLNNLQTRIIHTFFDETSQYWAAGCIGKSLQWRNSESWGTSTGNTWGESTGESEGYSFGTSSGNSGGFQHHASGEGLGVNSGGGGRNENTSAGKNKGRSGGSNTSESIGGSENRNEGYSRNQVMDFSVEPSFFGAGLRMGGAQNDFMVDGVFMVGGRRWETNGKTWLACSFPQGLEAKAAWKFWK